MIYSDRNNKIWSIENGDWQGFQYLDDKLKEKRSLKKRIKYLLFLAPLVLWVVSFTIQF